jgi:alanyl-tRNA synthetase
MNHLRTMADELKNKLGSGVIILGAVNGEKVNLIAAVTKDLTSKGLHAGKLVKAAAEICGGGGGGRPDMAQAGGKNPDKLAEALTSAEEWVKSVL